MKQEAFKQQQAQLQQEAEQRKQALKAELEATISQVERKGRNIVVIGGVLVGAYLLLEAFRPRQKVIKHVSTKNGETVREQMMPAAPAQDSYIIRMIKEHIAQFVLNMLTQTLNELIDQLGKKQRGTKK